MSFRLTNSVPTVIYCDSFLEEHTDSQKIGPPHITDGLGSA